METMTKPQVSWGGGLGPGALGAILQLHKQGFGKLLGLDVSLGPLNLHCPLPRAGA